MSTSDWIADFLQKAEEYQREGVASGGKKGDGKKGADKTSGKGKGKAPGKATLDVEQAAVNIKTLYERALDPTVTREQIEAAADALDGLTKVRLDALAVEMGFTQKFKTKGEVIKAIRLMVLERKGAFERATV